MQPSHARGIILLAIGAAVGWVGSRTLSMPPEPADSNPGSEVLAVVGGSELTRADVEAMGQVDFAQRRQQTHDLTTQAMEQAIRVLLVRLEAEARDLTPEELVAEEVDAYVQEPSDEAVAKFFQDRSLQGNLEDLAPQIRTYLKDQSRNARFAVFMAELENRYDIQRLLEPLRTTIATEGFPSKGRERAPVTIVEFSDFQCPYCRLLQDPLSQVEAEYGDQVRFVFRQFPLSSIHPDADKAGEASLCAFDQGMFWEMHNAMFESPNALGVDELKATAANLGMDSDAFDECLDSGRHAADIAQDIAAGQAAGVRGTPMIFVNGRALSGLKTFEEIAEVIDDELQRAR